MATAVSGKCQPTMNSELNDCMRWSLIGDAGPLLSSEQLNFAPLNRYWHRATQKASGTCPLQRLQAKAEQRCEQARKISSPSRSIPSTWHVAAQDQTESGIILRLSVELPLRYRVRQLSVMLFHEPPHATRRAGIGGAYRQLPRPRAQWARTVEVAKKSLRTGSRVQSQGMGQVKTRRKPKP